MVKEVKNGMTFMRERKAISPVIATVILVAVAITVAVGVSYWMSGISSQYTQFEKVEIQTGYASYDTTLIQWNVTMVIKNSGSTDASINMCFINDVPCANYDVDAAPANGWGVDFDDTTGVNLKTGESQTLHVYIGNPAGVVGSTLEHISAGTTVNVKLHSSGGMDYIKLIRLP